MRETFTKEHKRTIDDVSIIADSYGWDFMVHDKKGKMLSFKKEGKRINVYYTTLTIGVCVPGNQQTFHRKMSLEQLEKLFISI